MVARWRDVGGTRMSGTALPTFRSLQQYVEPLSQLIGPDAAWARLTAWLNAHLAKVDNATFADRFKSHFPVFNARPSDYTHRIVRTGDMDLLGGIRFYGGESAKPFVDIIAWNGDFNLSAVLAIARAEWSDFSPTAVRIFVSNDFIISGGYLDQGLHAARVDRMPAHASSLVLDDTVEIDLAHGLARQKHDEMRQAMPDLAAELFPIDIETLAKCQQNGTLHLIRAGGAAAGLIATLCDQIEFLPCHVVVEEIVLAPFNGRGSRNSGSTSTGSQTACA